MRFGPREKLDALARAWTLTAFGMLVVALVAGVAESSEATVLSNVWSELAPAIELFSGWTG